MRLRGSLQQKGDWWLGADASRFAAKRLHSWREAHGGIHETDEARDSGTGSFRDAGDGAARAAALPGSIDPTRGVVRESGAGESGDFAGRDASGVPGAGGGRVKRMGADA